MNFCASIQRGGAVQMALFAVLLLAGCSDTNEVVEPQKAAGEYLFVERIILTDATLLRGDSSRVRPPAVEPGMFYTFDSTTRSLNYRSGQAAMFPITNELSIVAGDKHFFLPPLAGAGGGTITLTPVYYLPLWIDPTWQLSASTLGGQVEIQTSASALTLYLSPGSSFSTVITRVDSVRMNGGGCALLEYHDSITIKNHGKVSKAQIKWSPL